MNFTKNKTSLKISNKHFIISDDNLLINQLLQTIFSNEILLERIKFILGSYNDSLQRFFNIKQWNNFIIDHFHLSNNKSSDIIKFIKDIIEKPNKDSFDKYSPYILNTDLSNLLSG
jgi:hypothetical protein